MAERGRRSVAASVIALALALVTGSAHAANTTLVCAGTSEEGQRQRADGKLVAAHDLFTSCARQTCPQVIHDDCVKWLAEVDAATPSVVLVIRDANGRDVPGSVLIDGSSSRIPDGLAIPMDPGPHAFKVTAGDLTSESTQIVSMGDRNRQLVFTLKGAAARDGAQGAGGGKHDTVLVEQQSSRPIYPFIIAGAGVLSLVFGMGFQITALQQDSASKEATVVAASDREITANPNTCVVTPPDRTTCPVTYAKYTDHQAAVLDQTLALPLLGVGLAATITGVVLIAVTWPKSVAKTASSLHVVPSLAPGRSGILVGGEF